MIILSERASLIWYVFLLGLCWALGIVFGRISLSEGFPVTQFAAIQAIGISLTVTIVAIFTRELARIGIEGMYFFIVSALFLVIIPFMVTYLSLSYIGASRMGILLTTTPVFTALISMMAKTETVHRSQFLGILCGFVGVIILSMSDSLGKQVSANTWIWTIFAILSPLSYALANILCFRFKPSGLAPLLRNLKTNRTPPLRDLILGKIRLLLSLRNKCRILRIQISTKLTFLFADKKI